VIIRLLFALTIAAVSDSSLVAALTDLFRCHATELKGFLRARRGAADAEDLVQESFVRLLQTSATRPPYDPRAWLYRTGANLAADAYDYRQVREKLHVDWPEADDEAADPCADPARHADARQRLRHVWAALQRLPEPCRQAFLLNRLEGMSQRVIARQLGISEKTVERHILRALEACRHAEQPPHK
jgi:RNA polymerase sigma-70 factor (ECF subfamily)